MLELNMSLANYFTFIRIFISPIFLLVYLKYSSFGISTTLLPYILLFLLGVSEISDFLDGYIARKRKEVTDLGKILDPMADSIYRISVFLTFTLEPVQLPMLIVFMFLYRDSCISTLRTVCALKGYTLAARRSGKIKAVVQGISAFVVLLLMIPHSLGKISTVTLHTYSSWIVGIAGLYTLASGIEYLIANRSYIRQALTGTPHAAP
jgi:CDP-diacylglycerol--glycerol-3-phosphate 3-phosphatidyltransferase